MLRQDTSYGWSYFGLVRFIEDYLDPKLYATGLHQRVFDPAFFHGHAYAAAGGAAGRFGPRPWFQ